MMQLSIKNKNKKTFDWKENEDNFYKGLRSGEVQHFETKKKNPFSSIWSTDVTRRYERSFKKRDL
jgi:hypothetical protein